MSMRRASRTRILRTLEEQVPVSKEEQEERDALVDGGEDGPDQGVHACNQQNHADSIWIRGRNGVDRELKRRVTIKDLSNLDEGDRVIVRCNRSYEPNTKAAYLFSSFLYDIVMIETCAPLSILTWDNVCFDDYKIKMIQLIESKFLYHVNVRTWVLDKLNRAWRKYKADLKKIYNSFTTVSDALKNTPENVNAEHWRVLVSDWCSEKKKKQCEINRINCKSKKKYHAHGRKSLARMSKELEDEKDWDSPDCGTSTEAAQRKKVLKSLSDKDTCSVTSKDKYHDKKRKTIALTSEQAFLALEATPKKTARIKTCQVGKTLTSETITPQVIRSEPVVPYTRKSRRLANSTPSKQLPLSSEMRYVSESSDSKRKRIGYPEEEALMVEESEEDVDDGSDEDYDATDLEAPNFSYNEEDEGDEGKDNGVVEEVGAEMEGAPEETIAAIDQLVEEVNRPSGQAREPEENEEQIAAPRKGNSKKGHEKKKKALKDDNPSQPDTAPGKQLKAVILPHPSQDHLVGASSSNPNQFTGSDNTEEILSHASQFEQIVKKMQDDCLHLRALYFTNMEKLKVKDDSVAILSLKCGGLEEEAKGLREEKVLLKQKVEGLEIRLKEAEKSLPSEELEEKLLQLQLELNDAKSREIEAKRALAGKELEMIQKDNEILRLKAQSRSNSRLSNCTCNSTKSSSSNSLEITKELVDQVMASDIFKSQQAIKEYEWMYYSMRCALIRAHFNLNIPSENIWKIVTMHPNEAAIASETEGSILQYINHVLSLWVQLMNKGSGSPEEQAEFVKQELHEVPFPFTDGKEAFQYQKKPGSQPDPWYDMFDRSFGSPSVPSPSLPSAAAIVSARSKDDDLLWHFDK